MDNSNLNYWFEKGMAVIFLLMIVGMILFFNFVPLEKQSEDVILVILGVLLGAAKDALPRIFGVNDDQQDELYERIQDMENQIEQLTIQNETLKIEYDKILKVLIENYVASNTIGDSNDNMPKL